MSANTFYCLMHIEYYILFSTTTVIVLIVQSLVFLHVGQKLINQLIVSPIVIITLTCIIVYIR